MRIISGKFRGRQIRPPSNLPARPTTDYAKESLFNILNHTVEFEGLEVLDLFAGTGGISYEFFSRGCGSVTAVDLNPRCIRFIREMAAGMQAENLQVVRANCFQFLKKPYRSWDLVFADPPYDLDGIDQLPGLILGTGILKPGGLFILEHSRDFSFEQHPCFEQHRDYGSVNFSFFRE